MITWKRITRVMAPVALAAAGLVAAGSVGHAYPNPPGSIVETQGCATTLQGQTCLFGFRVLDAKGNPEAGCVVTFTESGVPGTLSPTGATSDSLGNVTTTFTAGTTNGNANVTAACANHGTATGTTVVVSASIPNTGGPGSGGLGSGGLPNTGASPPGPNPVLFLGLGLALMIMLGGAITLRRSRDTAS